MYEWISSNSVYNSEPAKVIHKLRYIESYWSLYRLGKMYFLMGAELIHKESEVKPMFIL